MVKMKGLVLVLFLFSFYTTYSQAIISFSDDDHDFGTIKEINGAVSYNFVFTNTGNAPVIVKNVESSCGCTSPEWSKQPILPGKTGFIKATFDPKNRPGHFDKTITVFSNAKTPAVELRIKGSVEGKARTILDDYPYELPSGLRLSLDHLSLMKAKKGSVKNGTFGVYNNAGKKVSVAFAGLPVHLKIVVTPQQLEPGQTGTINVVYNTVQKGEFGLNEENVTLIVDGKKFQLPLSISIEESFDAVDNAAVPLINVDKKYYNFGTVTSEQGASYTYKIKNDGKSPMKIHRFYANDKRMDVQLDKRELQPGETADLTVKINQGAQRGKLSGIISVISNSPANPELNIRFYGEIK